jgi:polysaccharide biosynthesis protein PslH
LEKTHLCLEKIYNLLQIVEYRLTAQLFCTPYPKEYNICNTLRVHQYNIMKILFLSSWFPYPPINGAKIRIYNLIRELAAKHEIVLLSFVRTFSLEEAQKNIPSLSRYCQTVKVVPARPYKPNAFNAFQGLFSRKPRSVIQTYSHEMANLLKQTASSESYDVLIASEVNMPYLVSQLASEVVGIPKILDSIEVSLAKDAYRNAQTLDRRIRDGLTWLKLRGFTKSLLQKVEACTVPSEQEKQNILEIMPGYTNVKVVPHSLDLAQYTGSFGEPSPNSLVYTGSFTYHANFDAVDYFLKEIYPRIKLSVPEVSMQVLGDTGGVQVENWPIDNSVVFTGLLYDVRPSLAQSWLSIVPLRIGAGTRLKIIESLALGTPVVSTSKGAEGLDVTHGKNILIADTPSEFANAVLNVLQNPDLREKLSREGHKLVVENYSSSVMGVNFNSLLERIVYSNSGR